MFLRGRRKHGLLENFLDDLPLPTSTQKIVEIVKSRGNYLFEAKTADGTTLLISMPNKFRNVFFIRPRMHVLIEDIKEGKKVKGEIVKLLTKEHVEHYKSNDVWPKEFELSTTSKESGNVESSDESDY